MIKQLTLLKVVILTFIACTTIAGTKAQQAAIQSTSTPATDKEPHWVKKAGARKFPSSKKQFRVNDYGAAADGKALNIKAILE